MSGAEAAGQQEVDRQQMIEQQKQQCIFCKIVRGEIPSKKVFEDDKVLAILDIRPATKGHILVMPKEHYYIMPLIPPDEFQHFSVCLKGLSAAVKKALVAPATTIFVANGMPAGQQSLHFMAHIVPADEAPLENFRIPENDLDQSKLDEIQRVLSHNLPAMLKDRATMYPLNGGGTPTTEGGAGGPAPSEADLQQILEVLDSNPAIRNLLIQDPEGFKQQVESHPQLSTLFAKVDINALSERLKALGDAGQLSGFNDNSQQDVDLDKVTAAVEAGMQGVLPDESAGGSSPADLTPPVVEASTEPIASPPVAEQQPSDSPGVSVQQPTADSPVQSDVVSAANLNDEQLIALLNEKPKLKELLLGSPDQLQDMAASSERVASFLGHETALQIHTRVQSILSASSQESSSTSEPMTSDTPSQSPQPDMPPPPPPQQPSGGWVGPDGKPVPGTQDQQGQWVWSQTGWHFAPVPPQSVKQQFQDDVGQATPKQTEDATDEGSPEHAATQPNEQITNGEVESNDLSKDPSVDQSPVVQEESSQEQEQPEEQLQPEQSEPQVQAAQEVQQEPTTEQDQQEHSDVPRAIDMTDDELRSFIQMKKTLHDLLQSDIDRLKELVSKSERLQIFFSGTDIETVQSRMFGNIAGGGIQ